MISAKVVGIPDLKAALASVVPKLRRQALRNALAAGARIIRDDARRRAPVLQPTLRAPYRKPGTVRSAISVRTSKAATRSGDVGVFVNVRPAKGAKTKTLRSNVFGVKVSRRVVTRGSQRGAKSPNDPFYWRFLEFGTKKMSARAFLQPAAGLLGAALDKFKSVIGPQIERLNKKGGTL
jgi:HK97 gp10 family phage protein